MYQTIRYEKNGNIGIVTINRPEALNALNSTVISEFAKLELILNYIYIFSKISVFYSILHFFLILLFAGKKSVMTLSGIQMASCLYAP